MPEIRLPRHSSSVAAACEVAQDALEAQGWPSRELNRALLVVSEAVSNSVEHGDGEIELSLAFEGDTLTVSVSDEGPGVRDRRLYSASLPVDVLEDGGRGLYILRTLADDLEVENGRLTITVVPAL